MTIRDGVVRAEEVVSVFVCGDRQVMIPASFEWVVAAAWAVFAISGCGAGGAEMPDPRAAGANTISAPKSESCERPEIAFDPTEPRARAKAAFERGMICARAGDYDLAAANFEAANKALPHPATTLNLAIAYDWAGKLSRAVDAYEEFLRVCLPSDEAVEFAIERIEHLRKGLPGGCTSSERIAGIKCPPPPLRPAP
jgi:hypothetical protein